jgi:hypothetical protein
MNLELRKSGKNFGGEIKMNNMELRKSGTDLEMKSVPHRVTELRHRGRVGIVMVKN